MKVKVKSLSSVLTLCDPMDCSLPGFSVHGIFQARVLEWVGGQFLLQDIFPILYCFFRIDLHKLKHSCHAQEFLLSWSCTFTPSPRETVMGESPP